jgi:hypothetical protein
MIRLTGYVARGNIPEMTRLSDLATLIKWLDETWEEAKRDAEAWGLDAREARVVKLRITIEEEDEPAPA